MEIPVPALQARAPTHNRSASCGSLRKRRDAVYVPHEYAQAARVQYTLDTIIEKDSYFADYYEDSTANKENMEQRPFKRTDISESKSGNRGYSKRVNMILSTWLENNRNNPYPTPAQRQMLMRETELTKMQLKNWFCNIRRRKLPHTIRRPKKSSFCDF
ncbi:homeodomain super [Coemansia sp. Benny D115]|nr:homeodomain super [Coemansia sp. Benny D115]